MASSPGRGARLAPPVHDVPPGLHRDDLEVPTPTRQRLARWLIGAGAAVLVLVLGVLAALWVDPTSDPVVAPVQPEGPAMSETRDVPPVQPEGPNVSETPVLGEPTDSFVYLSTDNRLTIVDVDSGEATVHRLPELAPGDPPYRLIRRGNRLVLYGQTNTGPATFAVEPDSPTEPGLIGEAWFFIPGATNDTIWLAQLDESSPDTVRALASIREVAVGGNVVTSDVVPPDGRWPTAAVEVGLLFQGDEELELWDPRTGRFIDSFPGPFAVATWRNRMVTCQQCDQLHLIDLDTGTDRVVELPSGVAMVEGYGGTFSDDGRYAAVIGYDTAGPIGPSNAISVVVVDFDTATATTIPGIRTERGDAVGSDSGYRYPQLAWNTDGTWLFFSVGSLNAESGQLFAYRPGDDTALIVPIVLDGQYYGMAAR